MDPDKSLLSGCEDLNGDDWINSLIAASDYFTPAATGFDVLPFSSTTTTTAPTAQGNLPNLAFSDGNDEEAKRNTRLMRNRENSKLYRQKQKKHIAELEEKSETDKSTIDELEEKVKSANSTIAELNNAVAYLSSENVQLKQRLAALNPNANPLPYNPSWAPPFPYPAYPLPAVAPAGRVPLLPIPRLKSSPPSSKPRKQPLSKTQQHNENPNPSKRVKKLASVDFLRFFPIFIFLVGATGIFRANVTELSPGLHLFNGGGRVLTSWEENNSTVTNNKAVNNHIYDFDRGKGKGKEEILNSVYPQNFSSVARAAGPNLEIQKQLFEGATENQTALASNPKNDYIEDMQPTSADRSLQQWFREGLAGGGRAAGFGAHRHSSAQETCSQGQRRGAGQGPVGP